MTPSKFFYLSIIAVFVFAGSVLAQETPPQTPSQPNQTIGPRQTARPGFRRRQMKLERARRVFVRSLNLTEEQRQQQRLIRQRYAASTKPQRQQLFDMREKRLAGTFTPDDRGKVQAIRQEMRTSMQAMRAEMLSTLTTEQRSQVEAFREQRKQRREEMFQRRQKFLENRPIN